MGPDSGEPAELDLDFEDADECLSRWMLELDADATRFTVSDWSAFRLALAGERPEFGDGRRHGTVRWAQMYAAGSISGAQFAELLSEDAGLRRELWAAAAVHRAGADWVGHLLAAAAVGCRAALAGPLASLYLGVRNERELHRIWRRREADTPSDFGEGGGHRLRLARRRLETLGWNAGSLKGAPEFGVRPGHSEIVWCSWRGHEVWEDNVFDAAIQSRAGGREPLVVDIGSGWLPVYVLPDVLDTATIDAVELVSGVDCTMVRHSRSPSGWALVV